MDLLSPHKKDGFTTSLFVESKHAEKKFLMENCMTNGVSDVDDDDDDDDCDSGDGDDGDDDGGDGDDGDMDDNRRMHYVHVKLRYQ